MRETHRYLQEHSKIPLLIGANLEYGGSGIATDGTYYATQMQVAATGDPENAYRLGRISCQEGSAVGCNWAFAPVIDIDRNWRNPITNVRTYGNDPDMALSCGKEYLRAAQEAGVLAAIKHFPGMAAMKWISTSSPASTILRWMSGINPTEKYTPVLLKQEHPR